MKLAPIVHTVISWLSKKTDGESDEALSPQFIAAIKISYISNRSVTGFDCRAMYGKNFKPKIFADITTPAKQSYGPNTGEKSQVLNPSNFGLISLDITDFLMLRILSIYQSSVIFGIGKISQFFSR